MKWTTEIEYTEQQMPSSRDICGEKIAILDNLSIFQNSYDIRTIGKQYLYPHKKGD